MVVERDSMQIKCESHGFMVLPSISRSNIIAYKNSLQMRR